MALYRKSWDVLYTDGHAARYRISPLIEMQYERETGKVIAQSMPQTDAYEFSYRAACADSDGIAKGAGSFDAWIGLIESIDYNAELVPPTAAAASGGSSPSSPSQPE